MGVFDTRRDVLVALTKWLFGDASDLLVQFCAAYTSEEFTWSDTDWVFEVTMNRCKHVLPLYLLGNVSGMGESDDHPYFLISSLGDVTDVLDPEETYMARDVFDGIRSTLSFNEYTAVYRWIHDETIKARIAFLVLCHVVHDRNGFEGNIKQRIASFLFKDEYCTDEEWHACNLCITWDDE